LCFVVISRILKEACDEAGLHAWRNHLELHFITDVAKDAVRWVRMLMAGENGGERG
jgi:hypothetical protein